MMERISNKKIFQAIQTRDGANNLPVENHVSLEYTDAFALKKMVYSQVDNAYAITLVDRRTDGCCPFCGMTSHRINSYTERYAVGTPIQGKEVYLNIQVTRLFCDNPQCSTKTFQLSVPFLEKYGRIAISNYTVPLMCAISGSINAAEIAMKSSGIHGSYNLLHRTIAKTKIIFDYAPIVIGVDEVFISHKQGYYTIVYDMFSHVRLAILPGRDGSEFERWLEKNRDTVRAVCRDRASSYSAAVEKVCLPGTIQIADKFHLESNKNDHITEAVRIIIPHHGIYAKIEDTSDGQSKVTILKGIPCEVSRLRNYSNKFPSTCPTVDPPLDATGTPIDVNFGPTDYEFQVAVAKAASMEEKASLIRKVRQDAQVYLDHGERVNAAKIGEKYSISSSSVYSYIRKSETEVSDLTNPEHYVTAVDYSPVVNIIYKLAQDNILNPVIFSYIKSLNLYNGPDSNLEILISRIGVNHFNRKPFKISDCKIQKLPEGIYHWSYKDISRALCTLNEKARRDENLDKAMGAIIEKYPALDSLRQCARDFSSILKNGKTEELDPFIEKYMNLLPSFCIGLKNDREAIMNTIQFGNLLSSGPVEGCNNSFKTIKRMGYGRYGLKMIEIKLGLYALYKNLNAYELIRSHEYHIPAPPPDHPILLLLDSKQAVTAA